MSKKTKEEQGESKEVIAGVVGKLADYCFNPSDDKLREMTVIDRLQAKQFPILDMIAVARQSIIDTAQYMVDFRLYKLGKGKKPKVKPEIPNLLLQLIHRIAQWNKSVGGINLKAASDLALAEVESTMDKADDAFGGEDPYMKE